MIFKRILFLLTITLSIFTLAACGEDTPEPVIYTLTVSSNVEEVTPISFESSLVEGFQSYVLSTYEVDGYTFEYWHLEGSTDQLSTELSFTYIPSMDSIVEAYYSSDTVAIIDYTITVTSNIESITLDVTNFLTNSGETQYELTAPTNDDYVFIHWIDVDTEDILSTNLLYTFVPSADQSIEAVYELIVTADPVITVTSNVENITVTVNETTTGDDTEYELIATVHEDYTFLYWIDANTEAILSTELTYTFIATVDQSIEAIYESNEIPEPVLFYETTFDDASKTSYVVGVVTLSGENWTLDEALLGTLATDLKIEGKSVRIRDGYIQTVFTVTDIAQVMFYAGTYGGDANTTVNFQISTDTITWITVDSFVTTTTFERHSYIFNESLTTSLGIDTSNAYYLRIESETVARTNIDNLQIYTGEGFIADDTPLYSLTITDMDTQYLLNETVDLTGCVATHPTTGVTTCDITGTVDTSIAGVYEIIFSKTDEFGNTEAEIVRFTVIDPVAIGDIDTDMVAYYDDAEGLFGDDLITALNIILNTGFTGVDYGSARYILDESDADPLNPSNLILVYLRTSISSVWDSGATWNREHVWPQSLLGVSADNGTVNVASDLYNLMPADPSENSTRSNQPYSALVSGYEPPDEVKGDVARALFYMMVMYENLNLVNTAPGIYEMGYLDELLAWHIADPVDAFEINRLEVIASYQNNRNPFVDYPHLVDLIWYYIEE